MLGARLRAAAYRDSGGVLAPMDYIARWDMAGDSTDETGNYDITLKNGATQLSDHVSYSGGNDYGQCNRLAVSNSGFTLVLRFRLPSIDGDGVWIVNSRTDSSGSQSEWQFAVSPSQELIFGVYNTSGTHHYVSLGYPPTGAWLVIACRFTASSVQMLDGNGLIAETPFSGSMNTGALNTQFGKRGWGYESNAYNFGELDQSRGVAYAYPLTDRDVSLVIDKITNGW